VLDALLLVFRDPPAELTLSPEAVSTIAGLVAKEDERIRDRAIEALVHVELEGLGDLGDAAPALASLLTTGVPGDKPRLFIAAAGASRSRPHVFDPCTDVVVRYAREGATPTRIAALLMLSNLHAVSSVDAVRSIAETASNDDVASTAENTIELLEDVEGLVTDIAEDVATDQAPDSMSG
jgi:hypothetical protein